MVAVEVHEYFVQFWGLGFQSSAGLDRASGRGLEAWV